MGEGRLPDPAKSRSLRHYIRGVTTCIQFPDKCLDPALPAGLGAAGEAGYNVIERPIPTRTCHMVERRLGFPILLSIGAAVITIGLKAAAYLLTDSVGLLSDAVESMV